MAAWPHTPFPISTCPKTTGENVQHNKVVWTMLSRCALQREFMAQKTVSQSVQSTTVLLSLKALLYNAEWDIEVTGKISPEKCAASESNLI